MFTLPQSTMAGRLKWSDKCSLIQLTH